MQQLARGKSEHDGKHYIKTKVSFELNKALHTNMENIRCDCNVTYSAKLVELEGDCINKENTLIRLNNYQCSMLNALGIYFSPLIQYVPVKRLNPVLRRPFRLGSIGFRVANKNKHPNFERT